MIISMVILLTLLSGGSAQAQTLTFTEVLQQAIDHSFDLKIGGLEVEISEQRRLEARAMYFPTLSLRLSNEYLRDLSQEAVGTVAVNDTLISGDASTFQDSLALSAGYQLYDFGARQLKYQIAEQEVQAARLLASQALVDLKGQTLAVYGRGLLLGKRLAAWRTLLGLRTEAYRLTERLRAAGVSGQVELGSAAILVAEAVQSIGAVQLEMEAVGQELAFLTGQTYSVQGLDFADLPAAALAGQPADVQNLPEIKAYGVRIAQKKTEYQLARQAWLPSLNLYSSCRLYGSDPANALDAFTALRERNATVGLVLDMNLFNGFSDQAKAERLEREVQRLTVERQKKVAEAERRCNTLGGQATRYQQSSADDQALRAALAEQGVMSERLAGQQLIDRLALLEEQARQVEKGLALELKAVEGMMNSLHLQIIAEGGTQ